MILDTSAVVAMVQHEPERHAFLTLCGSSTCLMSVASWVESCLVLDNRAAGQPEALDALMVALEVELISVSSAQGTLARAAHQRFGRGSGSPARLNYGDCFAYALAIETDEPLLFKGDDFRHTDVRAAL